MAPGNENQSGLPPLPVDAILPRLIEALGDGRAVVLRAPTGAGKTTRVPPALLDAGLAGGRTVVMLEPRRLAAQAAARRMAAERGGAVGEEVGYQIRFDRRVGPSTRIQVVTEGIFVRMIQDDPFLEAVGMVIFDEFHERNLNTDLALAMVRRVQQQVRPDLRVVVMSATLDEAAVARYLECPVVASEGRLHPVHVEYLGHPSPQVIEKAAAAAVGDILGRTTGDILVFLPGVGEIRRTRGELAALAEGRGLALMELFGDLPAEEQDAVLGRADRRKVVLSTNVAETSVTIEGITGVVDTGLARRLRWDPAVGLDRLDLCRISRASADQRAGRAGRTSPGLCLRLWTEREHRALEEHEVPEILRLDLAGPVLQLRCWGEPDVRRLPWLQEPPERAIEQAESLLGRLGALDGSRVSVLGERMARLPVHPRIARLLLEGHRHGWPDQAALAGALLSERDPFHRAGERRQASHSSDSDVLDRVQAMERFERSGRGQSELGPLDTASARRVLRARDQLLRLLGEVCGRPGRPRIGVDEALLRALLDAFPDRLARRRAPGDRRAVMVGGRGVRLADRSAVREPELFVCVEVEEAGGTEAWVRQASAIDRRWLADSRLRTTTDVSFDLDRERVMAVRRTRWDDLVLDEAATDVPETEGGSAEASRLLAEAAARRLDRALPLTDRPLGQFLARVRCLRAWMPELGLPAFDDAELREILPELCVGYRSFEELRRAPVVEFLKARLTRPQVVALDREAPERIAVPSGSRLTLEYEPGRLPVLAVRIQELFGLADTPRVAGGRVPVLMHLLAPNLRPQQVTDDLRSFWNQTYPVVRRELRRRYPKHAWPDDPWTAAPEKRPTSRRSKA